MTMPTDTFSDKLLSVALGLITILIIGEGLIMALYQIKMADYEKSTRAILVTVADGILQIQTNGVIESCNPAAEKIFGFDHQILPGQNFYKLIKAKSENEVSLNMNKLVNSEDKNLELVWALLHK